jgi:hypothetical protein
MESFIALLNFFSINPSNEPFVVLGALMIALAIWQNTKLNALITRIDATLNAIKTNINVIAVFLATVHSEKFNPGLLQAMSPLQLKAAAYTILDKSGFTEIAQ